MQSYYNQDNKLFIQFDKILKTKNNYSCPKIFQMSSVSNILHMVASYGFHKKRPETNTKIELFNEHEAFILEDGATVCTHQYFPSLVKETTPVVFMLETFDGSESNLFNHLIDVLIKTFKWRVVLFHRRGMHCQLTNPIQYMSGNDEDLKFVMDTLHDRYPIAPFYMIGLSAGGIIMSRYLGKYNPPYVKGGVMVSSGVHTEMFHCMDHRIGQMMLTNSKKRLTSYIQKNQKNQKDENKNENKMMVAKEEENVKRQTIYKQLLEENDIKKYLETEGQLYSKNIDEFNKNYCIENWIRKVECPLLILNAKDDIISNNPEKYIDFLKPVRNIMYIVTSYGGHCIFPSSKNIDHSLNWAEYTCILFFNFIHQQ